MLHLQWFLLGAGDLVSCSSLSRWGVPYHHGCVVVAGISLGVWTGVLSFCDDSCNTIAFKETVVNLLPNPKYEALSDCP